MANFPMNVFELCMISLSTRVSSVQWKKGTCSDRRRTGFWKDSYSCTMHLHNTSATACVCVSARALTSNGNVIETLKNAIDAKCACTYSAMIMTWNALARCTHFFVLPSIWQVCCCDKMICHMWINWNRKVSREIVAPKQKLRRKKSRVVWQRM